MPTRYSYTDAAERLLQDAVLVWAQGTREVAGHLAGLSAECALKSIMVGLGHVAVGSDGQVPKGKATKNIRKHVDLVWSEFQTLLGGRTGARYIKQLPPGPAPSHASPYHDWLIDHRYVAAGELVPDDVQRWVWAAIVVRDILSFAKSQKEAQT